MSSNVTMKKRKPCSKGTRWVEKAQKCMNEDEKRAFFLLTKPKKEEEVKVEKQEQPGIMNTIQNIFTPLNTSLTNPEQVQPLTEETPDNILLKDNEKKCPKDYYRHPSHSRNCTRKKKTILEKNIPVQVPVQVPLKEAQPEVSKEEEAIQELDISPNQIQELVSNEEEKEESKKESKEKGEKGEKEEEIDPEKKEYDAFIKDKTYGLDSDDLLYPILLDPDFQNKIANKKEFDIFRYDGTIREVKTHSKTECEAPFEISPYQHFVRHFMSLQTPYNSLLLYHSLGTGKTISAIGVTEDMRKYLKQVGMHNKKILVVASPAVQSNFRLQLFDPSNLREIGKMGSGIWQYTIGIGNDLLQEINPTQTPMTKEYIVKKVNAIIHEYYDFIGYDSLANYIEDTVGTVVGLNEVKEEEVLVGNERFDENKLKRIFDHRLIVIDEVHNIIGNENHENKRISVMLMKLVKVCSNLRFLFLSATPMYNSYKEIVWLLNIMNLNDQRSTIKSTQVFKEDGTFVEEKRDKDGVILRESGKDLLKRKLLGYVSYVRGENPYTFPFRIYPSYFAPVANQLLANTYPSKQFNGLKITAPITRIQVFSNTVGEYQLKGYKKMVQHILQNTRINNNIIDFEGKESFGYIVLQPLISALNIIYPNPKLDVIAMEKGKEEEKGKVDTSFLNDIYGKKGLNSILTYVKEETPHPLAHHFEYKPEILSKYGRIFAPGNIGKYSAKIAKICEVISKSSGIVLIYSKYIEGGLIPMALALEEMGFSRYGNATYTESLFKEIPTDICGNPIPRLNSVTMKPTENSGDYTAKYVMITGQKYYSPNNAADLKLVTDISNKRGEHIRVVLISEAGSEGLDFKFIRQVHILDPWYNMNRVEQVIGRAVRHKSHCALPIEQRNVEIYMHGSYIDAEEETADLYMYRLAEKKAFLIGNVTRVLKETAVDCLLNIDQTNFTEEKMNQTLSLTLSTDQKIVDFKMGDKSFSYFCDYMENCSFSCNSKPNKNTITNIRKNDDYAFLQSNHSKISKRIRQLYREKVVYKLDELIQEIELLSGSGSGSKYPIEQLYYTISMFLKNKEWLVDKKGHKGYMIQQKDMYIFQPIEIQDEHASIFERNIPLDYKRSSVTIELPTESRMSNVKPTDVPTKSAKRLTELGIQNASILPEKSEEITGILSSLQKHIEFILGKSSFVKPGKQDRNWYVYAKMALRVCVEKHEIDRAVLIRYVIFHFLDLLDITDKKKVLETMVTSLNVETSDKIEDIIRTYFIERIWKGPKKTYILLYNHRLENKIFSTTSSSSSSNSFFSLNSNTNTNKWEWVEDKLNKENETWLSSFNLRLPLLDKLNENENHDSKVEMNIGFIGYLKEGVQGFKNMNINNNRTRPNPGALCEQTDKKKLITKINDLLAFMGRNEKQEQYSEDPVLFSQPIERPTLCVIYEFLMRYFTEKEKQLWYLTPEQAVSSKLDNFVVKSQKILGVNLFVLINPKPDK